MTTETQEALSAEAESLRGVHDSDCAIYNAPALPPRGCNCWLAKAADLLQHAYDAEDWERFGSRYGHRLIAAARSRALPGAATGGGLREAAAAVLKAKDEIDAWIALGFPSRTLVPEPDRKTAKEAFDALRAALAATGEKAEGWRPISEASPQLGDRVIGWCTFPAGAEPREVEWRKSGWRAHGLIQRVTHFMPLPTPPAKEEGQ